MRRPERWKWNNSDLIGIKYILLSGFFSLRFCPIERKKSKTENEKSVKIVKDFLQIKESRLTQTTGKTWPFF